MGARSRCHARAGPDGPLLDEDPTMSATWEVYVLEKGDRASEILRAAAELGPLVLIGGIGFDPRTLHTLRRLREHRLHCRFVRMPLPGGTGAETNHELSERNQEELAELLPDVASEVIELETPAGADSLTEGSRLGRLILAQGIVGPEDVAIVDISALPTRIFFPLIGSLLGLPRPSGAGEVLVTASENSALDGLIHASGVTDPGTVTGFNHGFSSDQDAERIQVWAPVLGEGSAPQLEAIYDYLNPDEVYPILPFPSSNPRRTDDLFLEHRGLLLDRFDVSPRNFLHVDEANPFDTYRTLTALKHRYQTMMETFNDVEIVASTHGSKSLSLGVCLAALEGKLPVVNAGPARYVLEAMPDPDWVERTSTLTCTWLLGAPTR